MSFELLNTVLLFVSGGFLIFLAITVTRDNLRNRLNRIAGAMLFFAGLGPIFLAMGAVISFSAPVAVSFEDVAAYGNHKIWEFFFPFLLLFAWMYPYDQLKNIRHRWIKLLIFVPPLLHLLILTSFDQLSSFLGIFEAESTQEGISRVFLKPLGQIFAWLQIFISIIRTYHNEIFNTIYILYVAAALYLFATGYKLLAGDSMRAQAKTVLLGARTGLILLVLSMILDKALPWEIDDEIYELTTALAVLIGAGVVAYATVKHQFLNVRLVLRQSFVYSLTYAVLVGTYAVLIIKADDLMLPVFKDQAQVFSYVFITVLLMAFLPFTRWIDSFIRSVFIRTQIDHRKVLERFSRQIISILNPDELRRIISETLKTSVLVDQVYFVMFDDKVNEYAILASDDFPKRVILDREDATLAAINAMKGTDYLSALGNFEPEVKLFKELSERKVRLIMPMKEGEHLLGFVALAEKAAGYKYSSEDINLLQVLSNQMVTALITARLYVESIERLRLQEEVSMARQIQLDLLPSSPPKSQHVSIAVHSAPSRTIGGDFYDFIQLPNNRLGIVIADASGKGMPAALMIAQIQAMIRSEVNNGIPISTMLKNINQQIATSTSPEKYVTLFYGELDPSTGEFVYSNAGHNYPVLVRSGNRIEHLDKGGTVIGALPMLEFSSSVVKLESQDLLFLFTDGLSEAMNAAEEEYGEERVKRLICENFNSDPNSLVNTVVKDVKSFDPTDPPRDDTTIIAIKFNYAGRN
jgi:serine phosphatase RsbU (regulator of sigma subunit)